MATCLDLFLFVPNASSFVHVKEGFYVSYRPTFAAIRVEQATVGQNGAKIITRLLACYMYTSVGETI